MPERDELSRLTDDDFDALEDEVERRAQEAAGASAPPLRSRSSRDDFDPTRSRLDFEQLVRDALDELPDEVLKDLEDVAVVVSDNGAEQHAYGLYRGRRAHGPLAWGAGYGIAAPVNNEILIFRDTLVRDFGHDQDQLAAAVRRTVRHEVGHHLGLDEAGVRCLGL